MSRGLWWVLGVGMLAQACVHQAPPAETPGPPDQPVPSAEPRETVAFLVQLEPGPKCEEEFDLGLYEHRAVDLIQWDEHAGDCHDRRVHVRYLSQRIGQEEVIRAARRYAVEARIEPQTDQRQED